MAQLREYVDEDQFPANWKVVYVPVTRVFSDDILTKLFVSIGRFLYPPFPIIDIIERPRSYKDPVPNVAFLVFVLILFFSAFIGIAITIQRYLESQRLHKISEDVQYYYGHKAPSAHERLRELLPPDLIYDEDLLAEAAMVTSAIPKMPIGKHIREFRPNIRLHDASETSVVAYAEEENDNNEENDAIENNLVDGNIVASDGNIVPSERNIVPSEPCELEVAASEPCQNHQPQEVANITGQSDIRKTPAQRRQLLAESSKKLTQRSNVVVANQGTKGMPKQKPNIAEPSARKPKTQNK